MDISKMHIFQVGALKQLKMLFSSPGRTQNAVNISETGLISKEVLPLKTGYMDAIHHRMSWAVMHKLMVELKKDSTGDGENVPVLLISERSYMPLDPFNKMESEDIATLKDIDEIAKYRHKDTLTTVRNDEYSAKSSLLHTIVYGGFILTGLIVVLNLVQCGGGQ